MMKIRRLDMDTIQHYIDKDLVIVGGGPAGLAAAAAAKENGIDVRFGDPSDDKPGTNVILPSNPGLIKCKDADLKHFKESLIKKSVKKAGVEPTAADLEFLAEEVKEDVAFVKAALGL